MERNIFEKQRDLNDRLNRYRDEYFFFNDTATTEIYTRKNTLSLHVFFF